MKRSIPLVIAVSAAIMLSLAAKGKAEEAAAEKAAYIGVEACGKCHKRASTGDQLGKWQSAGHSKAYVTLASPEAAKIAKERGIADAQKDGKCLKCHVTAHGVDPALIEPAPEGKKGFVVADGVQCEACHGPGSLYQSRSTMKSREASVAAGLMIPNEKTCIKCHNKESPTFKGFNYEEMVKKISHPNPKKGGEGETE